FHKKKEEKQRSPIDRETHHIRTSMRKVKQKYEILLKNRACPKNCVNGHSEVKYGHGTKKREERKGHPGSDSRYH
ncbi:MAG: hypothetical protein FWG29_11515, partial [Treponema sp.]|nr:hypothetical protein [Treponema sp.]